MKIGSNIFSLTPQRYLNRTASALQTSLERLSSGKRINSARDDAAGLSMSTGLDAQVRGSAVAIRNANDGMSMLSVAEGAMNEMTNLLQSMRELAVQAANGTLSSSERSAINTQVSGLIEEFDRISSETDFNGMKLLDGTFGTRALQIGNTETSQIDVGMGDLRKEEAFQKTVGTGGFGGMKIAVLGSRYEVEIGDLNGDGKPDLIEGIDDGVEVLFGNGDGTFRPVETIASTVDSSSQIALGDVNGDSTIDILVSDGTDAQVLLGNGDGTFKPGATRTIGNAVTSVLLRDVNGDGTLDILAGSSGDSKVNVFLGNGDGTFRSAISSSAGVSTIDTGDVNGDGLLDVVACAYVDSDNIHVLLGNGDGTFRTGATLTSQWAMGGAKIADVNRDGRLDIVSIGDDVGEGIAVFKGNGDGTFSKIIGNGSAIGFDFVITDFNGDGMSDIAAVSEMGNCADVYLGNGDGGFKNGVTYGMDDSPSKIALGDLNLDGAMDLAVASVAGGAVSAKILFGNSHTVTAIADMDLTSQTKAQGALSIIDGALTSVSSERARIGSVERRLETTVDSLYINRENLSRAYSEIVDADIASETANLVRQQIMQQAGIAMLSQANVMQSQVLGLLRM